MAISNANPYKLIRIRYAGTKRDIPCAVNFDPIPFIVLGLASRKLPTIAVDRNPAARTEKCLAAGETVVSPVNVESVLAGDSHNAI